MTGPSRTYRGNPARSQGLRSIEQPWHRVCPQGEYDPAIADFTEAIRLDPSKLDAFIFRGVAYRDRKQYDRAIADLTEAIRVDLQLSRCVHLPGQRVS